MRRHLCVGAYVSAIYTAAVTWSAWAPARHTHARWVADIRNPSVREHLWSAAVRSAYTTASSAVVHPIMSFRSSHLVGDHSLDFGDTAVTTACSPCHDHVFPSCPDFSSAPRAQATREHRRHHIEHLLFECQCIPGLDSSVALTTLGDDLLRVCSGSDHMEAVLLAAFPSSCIPVVAATACVVPFLLDPAAVLGRVSPWHVKLQCLDLIDRSVPAWCVVCGVHPPASDAVYVGTISPACLVPRPCVHVVAPPTDRV